MAEAQEKPETKPALASAKPRCKATTRAGKPCQGRPEADGYCWVHSRSHPLDFAELGRKGGVASATQGRAQKEAAQRALRDVLRSGRDILRYRFDADPGWQDDLVAAFREPLRAEVNGKPDLRLRLQAGEALLDELYGRPTQSVDVQHELTITVVSRTLAALEEEEVIDLPASDVIDHSELEAGD